MISCGWPTVATDVAGDGGLQVEVIEAWPREFRSRRFSLPSGACVGDALDAAGIARDAYPAVAVFGERVALTQPLQPGDRVELLRPLLADPKDARRQRAGSAARDGARKKTGKSEPPA